MKSGYENLQFRIDHKTELKMRGGIVGWMHDQIKDYLGPNKEYVVPGNRFTIHDLPDCRAVNVSVEWKECIPKQWKIRRQWKQRNRINWRT